MAYWKCAVDVAQVVTAGAAVWGLWQANGVNRRTLAREEMREMRDELGRVSSSGGAVLVCVGSALRDNPTREVHQALVLFKVANGENLGPAVEIADEMTRNGLEIVARESLWGKVRLCRFVRKAGLEPRKRVLSGLWEK